MTIRCDFCKGFIFPGRRIHRRCELALEALDVDRDELRVVLYPGEEYGVIVTKEQLRQMRLRAEEEDRL